MNTEPSNSPFDHILETHRAQLEAAKAAASAREEARSAWLATHALTVRELLRSHVLPVLESAAASLNSHGYPASATFSAVSHGGPARKLWVVASVLLAAPGSSPLPLRELVFLGELDQELTNWHIRVVSGDAEETYHPGEGAEALTTYVERRVERFLKSIFPGPR